MIKNIALVFFFSITSLTCTMEQNVACHKKKDRYEGSEYQKEVGNVDVCSIKLNSKLGSMIKQLNNTDKISNKTFLMLFEQFREVKIDHNNHYEVEKFNQLNKFFCYQWGIRQLSLATSSEQIDSIQRKLNYFEEQYGPMNELKPLIALCSTKSRDMTLADRCNAIELGINALRKSGFLDEVSIGILKDIINYLSRSAEACSDITIQKRLRALFIDCCLLLPSIDDALLKQAEIVCSSSDLVSFFYKVLLAYRRQDHISSTKTLLKAFCIAARVSSELTYMRACVLWLLGMIGFLEQNPGYDELTEAMKLVGNCDQDKFFSDCFYYNGDRVIPEVVAHLCSVYLPVTGVINLDNSELTYVENGYALGRFLVNSNDAKYQDIAIQTMLHAVKLGSIKAKRYILAENKGYFDAIDKIKTFFCCRDDAEAQKLFKEQLNAYVYKGYLSAQVCSLIVEKPIKKSQQLISDCLRSFFANATYDAFITDAKINSIEALQKAQLLHTMRLLKQDPHVLLFLAQAHMSDLRLSETVKSDDITNARCLLDRAYVLFCQNRTLAKPEWLDDYYAFSQCALGDMIEKSCPSLSSLRLYAVAASFGNERAFFRLAQLLIMGRAGINDKFKELYGFRVTDDQRKCIGCHMMDVFLLTKLKCEDLKKEQSVWQRCNPLFKARCFYSEKVKSVINSDNKKVVDLTEQLEGLCLDDSDQCYCHHTEKQIIKFVQAMNDAVKKILILDSVSYKTDEVFLYNSKRLRKHLFPIARDAEQVDYDSFGVLINFLSGDSCLRYPVAKEHYNKLKQVKMKSDVFNKLLTNKSIRSEYLLCSDDVKECLELAKKMWKSLLNYVSTNGIDFRKFYAELEAIIELSGKEGDLYSTLFAETTPEMVSITGSIVGTLLHYKKLDSAQAFICYHTARILFESSSSDNYRLGGAGICMAARDGLEQARQFIIQPQTNEQDKIYIWNKILSADLCGCALTILNENKTDEISTASLDLLASCAQNGFLWGQFSIILYYQSTNRMGEIAGFFDQNNVNLANDVQVYYRPDRRDGNIWVSLIQQNPIVKAQLFELAEAGNREAQFFLVRIYCLQNMQCADSDNNNPTLNAEETTIEQYMEKLVNTDSRLMPIIGFLARFYAQSYVVLRSPDKTIDKKYCTWIKRGFLWGDDRALFLYACIYLNPLMSQNLSSEHDIGMNTSEAVDALKSLIKKNTSDFSLRKAAFFQLASHYHSNQNKDALQELSNDIPKEFGIKDLQGFIDAVASKIMMRLQESKLQKSDMGHWEVLLDVITQLEKEDCQHESQ